MRTTTDLDMTDDVHGPYTLCYGDGLVDSGGRQAGRQAGRQGCAERPTCGSIGKDSRLHHQQQHHRTPTSSNVAVKAFATLQQSVRN
jgi:hypothetical protein